MMKKSGIRTVLLLFVLIFSVLGGNFLFTGKESAAPLGEALSSAVLTENTVFTQSFTPQSSKITSIALALQEADQNGFSGQLTFTLTKQGSDAVLYSNTVYLAGVTDKWYLDFPVHCRLHPDTIYELTLTAAGYDNGKPPAVYLLDNSLQIPEITGCLSESSPSDSAALRFTYDVLVPVRAVLFLALLFLILGIQGISLYRSRKRSVLSTENTTLTFHEFLSKPVGKSGNLLLIHVLFGIAVTLLALIARAAFLPVESNDYYITMENWITEMRLAGGLRALGSDLSDYPPLYMTLLNIVALLPFSPVVTAKLLPCFFDFILAVVCVKLLKQTGIQKPFQLLTLYALILLNPVTLFNSAAWGQCDNIYSVFILLSLLFACKAAVYKTQAHNSKVPFFQTGDGICLLFAIAFCFKLQAVFFLPVICLLWITQKRNVLKPAQLLWVPIAYTISCIPSFLAGRSLKVMFKIYLGQANRNYGTLTLNYPNLYSLIGSSSEQLYHSYFIYGLLLTFVLLLLLFYQLYCREIPLDTVTLYKVTAVSILLICFCLPLVHERYAYIGEMLLFVLMIQDIRYGKIALITMLCTLFTYCTYLFQLEASFLVLPDWSIALLRLGVILYMIWDIFRKRSSDGFLTSGAKS